MGIVMSQWQWLMASLLRPVFSDPKSRATRACATVERNNVPRLRQRVQRMFLLSFPHCCSAHDQAAVGHSIGDGWELPRRGKDGGRIHG